MYKFPAEIDPLCVDEQETRRIMAKYRSQRPRKSNADRAKKKVSLPRLRCLDDGNGEPSQLLE
jgi:hypothetical protein